MHAWLVYNFMLDSNFTLVFNDDATAISDASAAETADCSAISDLQGRRLAAKPRSGLYVKNGKKFLVR